MMLQSAKTMTVTMEITNHDIALGARSKADICPAAKGLRRAFDRAGLEPDGLLVGYRWIHWWRCGELMVYEIKTPSILSGFLEDFDYGRPVKPLKLSLEVTADRWKGSKRGCSKA